MCLFCRIILSFKGKKAFQFFGKIHRNCKQNLNAYLKYDIVFAKSSNVKYSFTNAFFMVKPKHPFMKFCIDKLPMYVNNYNWFGKHHHVMNSTGPSFLTHMLRKYKLDKIPNHYILSKEEYAGDCNVCNANKCKGGQLFSHITGNSWHSYDSTFYNYCLCNFKKIMAGGALLLMAVLYLWLRPKPVSLCSRLTTT